MADPTILQEESQAAKLREYQRQWRWRAKNKAHRKEYMRQYRKRNSERLKEQWKQYYRANKDHIKWHQANYRKTDRGRIIDHINTARRRAARRSIALISKDQAAISAFYKKIQTARRIKCHWCKQWAKKADRQIDHITPLAKGGLHQAINLCCACKKCNHEKRARLPEEISSQRFLAFSTVLDPTRA